jgi:hypothetical protein
MLILHFFQPQPYGIAVYLHHIVAAWRSNPTRQVVQQPGRVGKRLTLPVEWVGLVPEVVMPSRCARADHL